MRKWVILFVLVLGAGVACQPGLDDGERNTGAVIGLTSTPTIFLATATDMPPEEGGAERVETPEFEMAFLQGVTRTVEKEVMPFGANLVVAPLFVGQPTPAFMENDGLVLQLHIFGFPDPKGAEAIVPHLVRVILKVAERYEVELEGIEVVFYRRIQTEPMIIFGVMPPWTPDQIFSVPVTDD